MPINKEAYHELMGILRPKNIVLVAVSKTRPVDEILELYALGHRDFGENYVQEMAEKQAVLPADIRWHFIGHLQRNKIKIIAPFVHLIHGVDSFKLLLEIDHQAAKIGRVIQCLLQMHIAREETKFGLDENELNDLTKHLQLQHPPLNHIRLLGLMGMASLSEDKILIREEFKKLFIHFEKLRGLNLPGVQISTLSMGMSGDYSIAIEEGSTMVRVGSLLFGNREPK